MPVSHSDLACYLGLHLIFLSMMALAPLALLQNQYLLVALTGQHVIVIVVVALLLSVLFSDQRHLSLIGRIRQLRCHQETYLLSA